MATGTMKVRLYDGFATTVPTEHDTGNRFLSQGCLEREVWFRHAGGLFRVFIKVDSYDHQSWATLSVMTADKTGWSVVTSERPGRYWANHDARGVLYFLNAEDAAEKANHFDALLEHFYTLAGVVMGR